MFGSEQKTVLNAERGFIRFVGLGGDRAVARTRVRKPKSPSKADELPKASLAKAAPPVVLVVEDEPTVRTLAESTLGEHGYASLSAANGTEALALLNDDTPIDLLFTDINMPDGPDGIELARQAVELRPGLRVLYTSGGERTDGMIARFVDGATFLQKPYTIDQLIEAVRMTDRTAS
jgi:CheY-like chemotaxis protein